MGFILVIQNPNHGIFKKKKMAEAAQPFYARVTGWEQQWTTPKPLGPGQPFATLSKPGNFNKVPQNHFKLYKWVKVEDKELPKLDEKIYAPLVDIYARPANPAKEVKAATSPKAASPPRSAAASPPRHIASGSPRPASPGPRRSASPSKQSKMDLD